MALICEDFAHYFTSGYYGPIYQGILKTAAARNIQIQMVHQPFHLKRLTLYHGSSAIFIGGAEEKALHDINTAR